MVAPDWKIWSSLWAEPQVPAKQHKQLLNIEADINLGFVCLQIDLM